MTYKLSREAVGILAGLIVNFIITFGRFLMLRIAFSNIDRSSAFFGPLLVITPDIITIAIFSLIISALITYVITRQFKAALAVFLLDILFNFFIVLVTIGTLT